MGIIHVICFHVLLFRKETSIDQQSSLSFLDDDNG